MTLDQVMRALERAGTAQNRKIYARHGAKGAMFGVSFANQNKMAARLKNQPELAAPLWATGNEDARVLATMIAGPGVDRAMLNAWVRQVDNYGLAMMLGRLAARTPHVRRCAEAWRKDRREFVAQAGWTAISHLAMDDAALDDAYFAGLVDTIERTVHRAPNRARYAMNTALIAIGIRNAALRRLVLVAARRIGPIEVDHGETGCKTPDVASYIAKTLAHRRKGNAGRVRSC